MYSELGLFINGRWIKASERDGEDVFNPVTGKSLARLPHATDTDLDEALAASIKGLRTWSAMNAYDRSRIMVKAADLVRERLEQIAVIMTLEEGKPIRESRVEVAMTADIIDWFAEEGRRLYGRVIPGRQSGVRQLVVQEPVGVVAAFTPWNFPTVTPVRKIATALGAGCSIIIKASEETPGSCVELVRCFEEAGIPAGVINLVFGKPSEISEHLMASSDVAKISFTGSVPVGKHLAALAAKTMKRATMELGGHAPVVVFDDADIDKSADMIAAFKYRNAGQVCISPTRFFIQENAYRKFVDRFTEYAKNICLGDGLAAETTMGPLANPRRLAAMEAVVQDGKDRGGNLAAGGRRVGNQGNFFEPTVFTELPDDSVLMTDEPFGPIASIVSFKSFDEVVERANSLPFGLASYAFTTSSAKATAIGDALKTGMVGINSVAISTPETPFGGIKESGYGWEGGTEGIEGYISRKFISQA